MRELPSNPWRGHACRAAESARPDQTGMTYVMVLQAFALSCSIFMTLMAKFRHSLKADIGVFFPMIMLKAIEPPVVAASAAQGRLCSTSESSPLQHP